MKTLRWFLLSGVLIAAANLVHAGGNKGKEGKLEGKWVAELDGKKIELTFAKDTFTITVPDKGDFKGTYKRDAAKKPAQLDMLVKEAPDDAKAVGKTALCIYEVQGDTLKWCANDPDAGTARPKEFPEKEGGAREHIYLIFKRAAK